MRDPGEGRIEHRQPDDRHELQRLRPLRPGNVRRAQGQGCGRHFQKATSLHRQLVFRDLFVASGVAWWVRRRRSASVLGRRSSSQRQPAVARPGIGAVTLDDPGQQLDQRMPLLDAERSQDPVLRRQGRRL